MEAFLNFCDSVSKAKFDFKAIGDFFNARIADILGNAELMTLWNNIYSVIKPLGIALPIILMIIGAIAMGGNPFFLQPRPGKKGKDGEEKIFKLIKFRTMNNKKDSEGNLLPDIDRLNKYGRILRATSIDELPEIINILKGDMSIVGPRPLAVQYLPYYTEQERHRHDVRPGLTGLAQVSGRNAISWEQKFKYDIEYIENISLVNDIKILFMTVKKVFERDGIGQGEEIPVSLHVERADFIKQQADGSTQ